MKPVIKTTISLYIIISSVSSQIKAPNVYSLDPDELVYAKQLVMSQSPELMPAYNSLIKEANKYLKRGPFTVMKKEKTPPSGDKHDYLSLSIYSWPNPNTKDGLPYITKDGQVNPESKKGNDGPSLVQMCDAVFSLSLAYYFSGNEKYAEHAALLLRTWFINPSTKMNPNLKYAQQVVGKNEGSPGGIIDSRNLISVTEAVGLIEGSKSWSVVERSKLIGWFKDYLNWLLTSDNGLAEGKTRNNHLSFYKAQLINYALFTDNKNVAVNQLESVKDLISLQIEQDGSQPLELNRTKSFNYSAFNLQALLLLAEMGRKTGIDLYEYQTTDGKCIKKALDFIVPYTDTSQKWPYKEIAPFAEGKLLLEALLRIALIRYADNTYENLLNDNFESSINTKKFNLLYPIK